MVILNILFILIGVSFGMLHKFDDSPYSSLGGGICIVGLINLIAITIWGLI
jgi:hypothetical protein